MKCFHSKVGLTLMEMMAVIAIMSVLVIIAAPVGQIVYRREQELLLKQRLNLIRDAIDSYYERDANGDGQPDNVWPQSWVDLFDSGYLRREDTVNPMNNTPVHWSVVVSRPDLDSPRGIQIKNGTLNYPQDDAFVFSPIEWHALLDSTGLPTAETLFNDYGKNVGMWDVRYPKHEMAMDQKSYYDEW